MYSTECLIFEHDNIVRMLNVIRHACSGILEGAEINDADFRNMIDFVRNYADKHHHGKEEKILFPEMVSKLGSVAETLITHGMLVEHDLGRSHILGLETALNEYKENKTTEHKLDILTEAMAYAHLLQIHIEKENSVVFTFAERQLGEDVFSEIDKRCKDFEKAAEEAGTQKHYLDMLSRLEAKYTV
ncbi:MAG: hemerythrin domain-containing protein [Hornefia sp.]|nr:hemerythrin domain-containing protein [Hornefia sp.]